MTSLSLEVLSREAATNLRRLARRERREQKKRFGEMNSRDDADLFWSDLSAFRVRAALQNDAPEESPLPELVTEQLHDSEEPEVAALHYAEANAGKPVLVDFCSRPSKALEERLRFAARGGKRKLHFYRLIGGWTILEFDPKTTGHSDSIS